MESLENCFSSKKLESIARETGFLKRKSKIDPSKFFDLLMYDVSSGKSKSLNQMTIEAESEHGITVSKQGLDKKFNDHSVVFLKRLIENQLSTEITNQIDTEWFSKFNRVIIKDGTRFDLQDDFKDILPGSGGCASEAGACIQFEFDLKKGSIIQLDITPANRPDNKEASEVLDDVEEGDLVIRDLGYHLYDSFTNIIKRKAFFISRLHPKINVYTLKNGCYQKVDFKDLYLKMTERQQVWDCKKVFIGGDKIPVNLGIEILPEDIWEKRVKNAEKNNKKKGRKINYEYKFKIRFNLFITNIPDEDLPTKIISTLYRIRWQIELIFKVWKSVFGINHKSRMKFERWLCLLYVKLLIMLVNWNIIMSTRNHMHDCYGKLLSLNKCFKTLFDNNYRLRKALKDGSGEIRKLLVWTDKIFNKNHWLERKKKSKSLKEIIDLKICKSNNYAYI
jgi:Transposase DDE domain